MCRGVIYTVWPKPQVQFDTTISYMLDPIAFSFTATGPAAGSDVLVDDLNATGVSFSSTPPDALSRCPSYLSPPSALLLFKLTRQMRRYLWKPIRPIISPSAPQLQLKPKLCLALSTGSSHFRRLVDRDEFVDGTAIF